MLLSYITLMTKELKRFSREEIAKVCAQTRTCGLTEIAQQARRSLDHH